VVASAGHDQQYFFEARVDIGEVGQIREVLSIRIEHHVSNVTLFHGSAEGVDPLAENRGRLDGWAHCHPKVWPININQAMFP
jgi:hypothetical protein